VPSDGRLFRNRIVRAAGRMRTMQRHQLDALVSFSIVLQMKYLAALKRQPDDLHFRLE
jgi:hypothetical protein